MIENELVVDAGTVENVNDSPPFDTDRLDAVAVDDTLKSLT